MLTINTCYHVLAQNLTIDVIIISSYHICWFLITYNAARVRREKTINMTRVPKTFKFWLAGLKIFIQNPDLRWVRKDKLTTKTLPNRETPHDNQVGTC